MESECIIKMEISFNKEYSSGEIQKMYINHLSFVQTPNCAMTIPEYRKIMFNFKAGLYIIFILYAGM